MRMHTEDGKFVRSTRQPEGTPFLLDLKTGDYYDRVLHPTRYVRRKEPPLCVAPPRRRVSVTVSVPNYLECGTEGTRTGDVLVEVHVPFNGSRYDIASKLRELANVIAHTYGDPTHKEAWIGVLMTRKTGPDGATAP